MFNEKKGSQKSISLKGIIDIGAVRCSYKDLNKIVHDEYK